MKASGLSPKNSKICNGKTIDMAVYVNSEASLMNWNVGKRIRARYYTKLPDKKLLSEKLQRAIAVAKEHSF